MRPPAVGLVPVGCSGASRRQQQQPRRPCQEPHQGKRCALSGEPQLQQRLADRQWQLLPFLASRRLRVARCSVPLMQRTPRALERGSLRGRQRRGHERARAQVAAARQGQLL